MVNDMNQDLLVGIVASALIITGIIYKVVIRKIDRQEMIMNNNNKESEEVKKDGIK